MLSRVAEHIYWLARHLERAEDSARLIGVINHLLLDFPGAATLNWESLVTITGSEELFTELYGDKANEENVLHFLIGSSENGGSILNSLAYARENLRTTREVLPRGLWEEVNQIHLEIGQYIRIGIDSDNLGHFLNRVIRSCETVSGMIDGNLSYTPVRTFIKIGRQIERADMTSRVIDVHSTSLLQKSDEEPIPLQMLQWSCVLKSISGLQMYRQQLRQPVRGIEVVRFLLQNQLFPRAIGCCLWMLRREIDQLPGSGATLALANEADKMLLLADINSLVAKPEELRLFVDELQIKLAQLHQSIYECWFELLAEKKVVARNAQRQG